MSEFSRKILIPNRGPIDVAFTRLHSPSGTKYFISFHDQREPFNFYMENQSGLWKLVYTPLLPGFVSSIELVLGEAIERHLAGIC